MTEDLLEQINFWNEFAYEYTEIQEETRTSIVEDISTYLKEKNVLPTDSFLDLAGGSGKYVETILPFVNQYVLVDFSSKMLEIARENHPSEKLALYCKDQTSFLSQTADNSFDVVFSGMNPALQKQNDLLEYLRIARKRICLLRVIEESDELFSSYEIKDTASHKLMERYKEWLPVPFESKKFKYTYMETVSKKFFKSYFSKDLSKEKLSQALNDFGPLNERENKTTIYFEALLVSVG